MVDEEISRSTSDDLLEEVQHDGPGQHIMVVTAHPDDAEYMIAGSVVHWVQEGRQVTYVICTNGDKGSSNPDIAPEQLAKVRQEEQQAACAVLGVQEVVFLGYADGLLQNTLELRQDIVRQIRRLRPDAVVCQDPTNDGMGRHISTILTIVPRVTPPWTPSSRRHEITTSHQNSSKKAYSLTKCATSISHRDLRKTMCGSTSRTQLSVR